MLFFIFLFQITKLKIDSNPFAKGFRDSSRLTDFERWVKFAYHYPYLLTSNSFWDDFRFIVASCVYSRETMESMLNEQQFLRSPLLEGGHLTLEERAMFAARFQLSLRAAAAEVCFIYYKVGITWIVIRKVERVGSK